MKDLNEITKTAFQAARYGLDIAATSVTYASDLLRDVSKHLRETGERIQCEPSARCTPNATQETPPPR
jgi:hypothetical protein